MDADWIKTKLARRVLEHWADARPAWLWSADGGQLLWRNLAARCFARKLRKNGARPTPEAEPIKGQVARLMRLGTVGRNSLARIQFLIGSKPASATCVCTPLDNGDGQMMLIVGADPIDADYFDAGDEPDALTLRLLPRGAQFLVVNEDGQIETGSDRALEAYSPLLEDNGLPDFDAEGVAELIAGGEAVRLTRYKASPAGAFLLVFEKDHEPHSEPVPAQGAEPGEDILLPQPDAAEPDMEKDEIAEPAASAGTWSRSDEDFVAQFAESAPDGISPQAKAEPDDREDGARRSLTALFDRLMDDEQLFTPLNAADDGALTGAAEAEDEPKDIPTAEVRDLDDGIEAVEAAIAALAGTPEGNDDEAQKPDLYRLVGRGFTPATEPMADKKAGEEPLSSSDIIVEDEAEESQQADAAPPDSESVERISRYNFDELSRILNDRVGGESLAGRREEKDAQHIARAPSSTDKALVPLAAETFVLNRLPLGLLVFRDQQILFANRALIDLVGYESVESIRAAGLAAIFPAADAAQEAGPLNHLVRRDGTLRAVNARLQSISWQGKPALMLSAGSSEATNGHESAVRAFAEILADAAEDGFIAADRSGKITDFSSHAAILFGRKQAELVGKPLTALIAHEDVAGLRAFLDKPARFAETARPGIALTGLDKASEILLFAQGQAGIVSGYFGFVRRRGSAQVMAAEPAEEIEPGLLVRISRGVRRPLNTIIGFADMLASPEFDNLGAERRKEYARDIQRAGQEVAGLVDELDDYARLREGRYEAQETDRDLGALLEVSVARLRNLANERRVLVRSAISELLPKIKADLPSLTQALLNLIASAIDHTPAGGQVVVSAKWADEGGIAIHIRDGAELNADLSDRFVVFRDGTGKDGEPRQPVRSSMGLSLTRALLAVNSSSLRVEPTPGMGTLFAISIPPDLIVQDEGVLGRG